MLRSLKELERYTVGASDGDIGKVVDFFLDDEHWAVRYLVAEIGGVFAARRVLISPIFFQRADWSTQRFELALTMEKIENSPSVDVDKPVSRQHERDYYGYYGYPYYWGYAGIWGMGGYPASLAAGERIQARSDAEEPGDVHLRSAREVRGYHIQGRDEAIGHVEDFIIDDETWQVRYLIVDTRNWWPGKRVLIAPGWASRVSWDEGKVYVDLSRQAIKDSPEWIETAPINRELEVHLYDYYGRPAYWDTDDRAAAARHSGESEPHSLDAPSGHTGRREHQ